MRFRLHLALVATSLSLAACASDVPVESAGPTIAIAVAPLGLAGIRDADYTITVTNGPGGGGDVVWTRDVSSAAYGDGAGSLSVVGPCDASTGVNTVELELTALYDDVGALAADAFMNPTPVSLEANCVPNGDVAVTFDLTLARNAQQGFFDVAVSFGDVFCSAKLDCVNDETGGDLELLFDPTTHARDLTAVFGFACTGSLTGSTFLYLDDPVVTCAGLAPELVVVDAAGLGNVDLAASPSANPGGYLFAASVFRGAEGLANKAYWNISFGLRADAFGDAGDCTLTARATASSEAYPQLPGGFPLPAGSVYPVIDWSVPLSSPTARVCTRHEVDVAGSGVATHYVGYLTAPNQLVWGAEPIAFRHRFDGATREVVTACDASCPLGACTAQGVCASCVDGVSDRAETGVDCGGPDCAACADGQTCLDASDCVSGFCGNGTCATPSCSDGFANGAETGVDCGGPDCPACADGQACEAGTDCASGFCGAGLCATPSCSDGFANGSEIDVDCGGPDCGGCATGQACDTVTDCANGACGVGVDGTCATSVCFDGAPLASGGVLTCVTDGGATYEVQRFTIVGSRTFVPPAGVSAVDVLVVAGGGGGGGSSYSLGGGGGGGAGGLRYATGVAVTPGQPYTIVVGGGGAAGNAGPGAVGGGSSAIGYAANGGGGGGSGNTGGVPSSGGSGGGAGYNGYYSQTGAAGIAGQGYAGGDNICSNYAAGGGGAGGRGQDQLSGSCGVGGGRPVNGGLGGPGLTYAISGVARTYAAGGDGSIGSATDGAAGAAGTGDGGNGSYAADNGNHGGPGGSGVVVIRYAAPTP